MSLSHKGTVVNIHDRRDRNSTNSTNQGGLGGSGRSGSNSGGIGGGLGRGPGGGGGSGGGRSLGGGGTKGPRGPKGSTPLPLPPLRPWDGSFPFDLIREITSPDLDPTTQIPKYDYYRAPHPKEAIFVSLYHVPCFLLHHVTNLSKISAGHSHSRDSMFAAAVLYGAQRFYASPEYLSFATQHLRFTDACTGCSSATLDTLDQDDIHLLISSLKLLETDCARGWKRQVNYRLPEHIHLQILPPERDLLPISQSSLWMRFYMDALREQPEMIPPPHLSAMNATVDDLYTRVGRLARRLELALDAQGIEPAAEPA